MKFDIITIFPKIFDSYFSESIIKRAQKFGKIKINIVDLRKFSTDKRKKVDDKPYGGGPGMVFKIEPLVKAISSLKLKNPAYAKASAGKKNEKLKIILFSTSGKQFDSRMAADWAKKYSHMVMIADHYEGIDARLEKVMKNLKFKIENLSIGPYVLTGGELPAMVVVDAVSRHISGVLGKRESLEEKRYGVGVPVFTRPEVFKWPPPRRGKKNKKYSVPEILLSGNHKEIEKWRKKHQKVLKS